MKFKIRYADQIVGIFSLIALAGLIAFIFALGAKQNWFVKKNSYHTFFDSGSGFSTGLDVMYKGFSIGKVKSVSLEGSMVRVDYYILGEYAEYVKEYSLVELITSPIGLGSSFVFHPGNGPELIPSDSEIFRLDSKSGFDFIREKKIQIHSQTDSIGALMNKVSLVLDNVNFLMMNVNGALSGKGNSTLKSVVDNINDITKNIAILSSIISSDDGTLTTLMGAEITSNFTSLLQNISGFSEKLASIAGRADGIVGSAAPEIDEALVQLNSVLVEAQSVLAGVKNIPLIKNGASEKSTGKSSTTQIRGGEF